MEFKECCYVCGTEKFKYKIVRKHVLDGITCTFGPCPTCGDKKRLIIPAYDWEMACRPMNRHVQID